MQPTSTLQDLPLRKNLRTGQAKVVEAVAKPGTSLNIKLPTGYGKTLTAAASYAMLKLQGRVNRALFVFPTDAQLVQFVKDGPEDLLDGGVDGPVSVCDIRYFKTEAIKRHRKGMDQVFAITVQSLINRTGLDTVKDLLDIGNWMVIVDEHHHYGNNGTWGKVINALPVSYVLAMSATPKRPKDDDCFEDLGVEVTYRRAVDEKAVKPLVAHSYVYRIDAVDENNEVVSYTTSQLKKEAGGDGDHITKMMISRKMRWSPKYVSPLLTVPIERMLRDRINSGYKLQAIVGAMCVSHAELVCAQAQSIFPELTVDWVGTGDDGRTDAENAAVLARFCPPKVNGKRDPKLDILVHVGMAGEGLDSTHVSEVIHLNAASFNISNNQENGRAARYLEGVTGNINFDSSSDYAKKEYVGESIMDAMDCNPPKEPDPNDDPVPDEIGMLPDEPRVRIEDMELMSIHSGSPEVEGFKPVAAQLINGFSEEDILDKDHPIHDAALQLYRTMRAREADANNAQSVLMQLEDAVKSGMTYVTQRAIRLMVGKETRVERSYAGDVKRRINSRKKYELGAIARDEEVLRKHYKWIKNLEVELVTHEEIPSWLA